MESRRSSENAGRALFLAAVLAGPLIVALPRHLPIQDYPQHLAIAQILTRYLDPHFDYGEHFEVDFRLRPYIGYYGIAWLLRGWASVDTSARLALSLYLLLTPLAVLAYAREVAPERGRAAWLVIPALYSGVYYMGLMNFLLGIPAIFLALWAMLRFTARGRTRDVGWFLAGSAVAYLCHLVAFGIVLVVSSIHAMMAPRRRPPLALVAGVAILAAVVTPLEGAGQLGGRIGYRPFGHRGGPPPDVGFQILSPLISLTHLLGCAINDALLRDGALWILALAAIAASAIQLRLRRAPAAPERGLRAERFVLPATSLLLVLAVPDNARLLWWLNLHFAPLLLLSFSSLVPARFLGRPTVAVLAGVALASVGVAASVHRSFDREAADFDAIAAKVRERSFVAPLMFDPWSRATLWTTPYLQMSLLIQVEKGGRGAELFLGPQIPVKEKPGGLQGMRRLQSRPGIVAARLPELRPDYVLVRGREAEAFIPPSYEIEARSGPFALFRRRDLP